MYHLAESHMSSNSFGSVTTPRRCLCFYLDEDAEEDDDRKANNLQCPACVQRALKPHLGRHEQALRGRKEAKEECTRHLDASTKPQRLSELQAESQRLRDRLAVLRNECAGMAVRVASQAVENDSHRELTRIRHSSPTLPDDSNTASANTTSPITSHRLQLLRLEETLMEGSFHHAIQVATQQARSLRFQWARKALAMHRLDIDPEDVKAPPNKARRARGIGKIGGLPLPHAGPELYGVLPPRELQSALRLVASVTCTVARCLGIRLPHPVLLTPVGKNGDITETVSDLALQQKLTQSQQQRERRKQQLRQAEQQKQQQQSSYGSASLSSLSSFMDKSYWKRSAKKALGRVTGQPIPSKTTKTAKTPTTTPFIPPPSMDSSQVAIRIHHATAAVLVEDPSPSSSKFALTTSDNQGDDEFAIALQLLQNNIVALCIRSGVPVSKLWPAEAVLLNLHALDAYCQAQTAVSY